MKLQVGDVVVLKTGGQEMTVTDLLENNEYYENHIYCNWWNGNVFKRECFDVNALNIVQPNQTTDQHRLISMTPEHYDELRSLANKALQDMEEQHGESGDQMVDIEDTQVISEARKEAYINQRIEKLCHKLTSILQTKEQEEKSVFLAKKYSTIGKALRLIWESLEKDK